VPKVVCIDKKQLQNLYLIKKLGSYETARILNCSPSLIRKRLKEFSIKTRNVQEAKALTQPRYQRKDFNNNTTEKAYIIGFRIGDLKENLLKLINLLKRYIRHSKRKNDMLILFKKLKYVRA
jgi:hypothetical protein